MRKLRLVLRLIGFTTWDSWSGFGVNTSWPKPYQKDVELIKFLFERMLNSDYVLEGPVGAAGGLWVMYVWPKDDPNVKKLLKEKEKRKLAGI